MDVLWTATCMTLGAVLIGLGMLASYLDVIPFWTKQHQNVYAVVSFYVTVACSVLTIATGLFTHSRFSIAIGVVILLSLIGLAWLAQRVKPATSATPLGRPPLEEQQAANYNEEDRWLGEHIRLDISSEVTERFTQEQRAIIGRSAKRRVHMLDEYHRERGIQS